MDLMRVLNNGYKRCNQHFRDDCCVSGCNNDNHRFVVQKLDELPVPNNYVGARDAREAFKTKIWIEPLIKVPVADSTRKRKKKKESKTE